MTEARPDALKGTGSIVVSRDAMREPVRVTSVEWLASEM